MIFGGPALFVLRPNTRMERGYCFAVVCKTIRRVIFATGFGRGVRFATDGSKRNQPGRIAEQ